MTKEEFIERTKKSRPYPLGDEALIEFEAFLEEHKNEFQSVRILQTLVKLNVDEYDGHRILIFDHPKIQKAFDAMASDLPEEFYGFTFAQKS